jgi:hypothetical protein
MSIGSPALSDVKSLSESAAAHVPQIISSLMLILSARYSSIAAMTSLSSVTLLPITIHLIVTFSAGTLLVVPGSALDEGLALALVLGVVLVLLGCGSPHAASIEIAIRTVRTSARTLFVLLIIV